MFFGAEMYKFLCQLRAIKTDI